MDALASTHWYLDHMAPIIRAMGRDFSTLYVSSEGAQRRAEALGLDYEVWAGQPGGLTLCASYGDLKALYAAGRRTILTEHGAGQTYISDHPSYAGGNAPARDACELFLVPGPTPAAKLRAAHPRVPVVEIGCPKLDEPILRPRRTPSNPPTVVVSCHWDCQVLPETRSAWREFANAIQRMSRYPRVRVVGHGHPQAMKWLRPWYRRLGIPVVDDFDEVLQIADCYVVDNSSTLFEAAACSIPVVVLNSRHYRRNVNHGLRFWEAATIGPQVDRPDQLLPAVMRALELRPADVAERERCIGLAYTHRDGSSAERAATAIRSLT